MEQAREGARGLVGCIRTGPFPLPPCLKSHRASPQGDKPSASGGGDWPARPLFWSFIETIFAHVGPCLRTLSNCWAGQGRLATRHVTFLCTSVSRVLPKDRTLHACTPACANFILRKANTTWTRRAVCLCCGDNELHDFVPVIYSSGPAHIPGRPASVTGDCATLAVCAAWQLQTAIWHYYSNVFLLWSACDAVVRERQEQASNPQQVMGWGPCLQSPPGRPRSEA